ncbi:MAG: prenyltransferase/squalene oxidase repeat-containing protein, partial [Planctomycetota bacterium]
MWKPLVLAALAALAPVPTALALPAQVEQAETPSDDQRPSLGDLKRELDVSLRWLRGQQDLEAGGYGSVEETAWAIRAYLQSHRGYRVSDGPFLSNALSSLVGRQRPDGALADEGAEGQAVIAQTLAAAQTLALIDEEPALSALADAQRFLRVPRVTPPAAPAVDALTARARARTMLAQRSAEGYWEGYGGRVVTTARNLVQLSRYYSALKAAAPESADAGTEPLPAFAPADRARVGQALERGAAFLVENRTMDGVWGALGRTDPGITAMVVGALASIPEPRGDAVEGAIERGLAYLLGLQREDGSIHEGTLANYITSATILALAKTGDPSHADAIAAARGFLMELQADEGEGYSTSHRYYGGVGYGGDERPDLSNLQLALEALTAAGLNSEDETFQKALEFLQRTQNRSESNDLVLEVDGKRIRPGNDGGAAYAPGESKAGLMTLADGTQVPRSYGSMTYALLRGYLFAGLAKDDPRLQAAWNWITENYTLDVNPGFASGDNPAAPY